jgi:hypothetical protein
MVWKIRRPLISFLIHLNIDGEYVITTVAIAFSPIFG